jgi:predicted DCC family thiol-disulfide oxidoreductase YuxK
VKTRRVYYNSACPVCRAGVANQREAMRAADTGEDIEWCDIVSRPEVLAEPGITVEAVRRKLYVEDDRGKLHIGADAFSALWLETPGRRWLGRLLALPACRRWPTGPMIASPTRSMPGTGATGGGEAREFGCHDA